MTAPARLAPVGSGRAHALAEHLRPWRKRIRTNDITIEAEPFVSGRRPRVVARVPRSADMRADHALADTIVASLEIQEAVRALLRDGVTARDGEFTYLPPPRAGADAIARLQQLLETAPPPPVLGRCLVCKVRVGDDG